MRRRRFLRRGGELVASAAAAHAFFPLRLNAAPAIPKTSKTSKDGDAWLAANRLGFGHRAGDAARFPGFKKWVDEQLHPQQLADADCDRILAGAGLKTLDWDVRRLWETYGDRGDRPAPRPSGVVEPTPATDGEAMKPDHQLPGREVEVATWIRLIHSRRQFHEVLVDFWHNHFNVFAWEPHTAPTFPEHDRRIRKHALGNFRELLEAVATSPSMLYYLDNYVNQSGNPNENYARELFELHTLGAESYLGTLDRTAVPGYAKGAPAGYVDGDVYEAARCFTGWRLEIGGKTDETGVFAYFEPWHDRFQKIVLGHPLKEYQPPMKDGRDVLDLLARHPGTARYVARKLCRRLVSDSPPEALVEKAARVFSENVAAPDQLRRVLRVIALSPELRAGSKFKRPIEFAASAIRAAAPGLVPTEELIKRSHPLGQRHFSWRTPDGYPDTREKWAGASLLINRWRFCNQLAHGNDVALAPFPDDRAKFLAETPRALLGREPARATLAALDGFLGHGSQAGPRDGLALALMSPEFQWR